LSSPHKIKGPLPDFTIVGVDMAGRILKHPGLRREVQWVVSLGCGEQAPDGWGTVSPKHRLRIEVDDLEKPYFEGYHLPNRHHIRDLLKFSLKACEGKVLVHCAQGVSRSSATALIMLAHRLGPGQEEEAVKRIFQCVLEGETLGLREAADEIHPNRLIVWMGDVLLGCEGRLWTALGAKMGRDYREWKPYPHTG
jgi:predicted protein tyrosine phosphatase